MFFSQNFINISRGLHPVHDNADRFALVIDCGMCSLRDFRDKRLLIHLCKLGDLR